MAGQRDDSFGVFAMLAAELLFIDNAGTAGMSTFLGS
jgi:hypothetical protein